MSQASGVRYETRIVETSDGWSTAFRDPSSTTMVPGLIGMLVMLGLGMLLLALGQFVGIALFALCFLPLLFTASHRWRHLRVTATGIELSHLLHRGAPRVADIRDGTHAKGVVLRMPQEPRRRLLFADIEDMGVNDYSMWFVLEDGSREEVQLEDVPREEIKRVYDELRPVWQRARAGLVDTADEARAARQRLASVQDRG